LPVTPSLHDFPESDQVANVEVARNIARLVHIAARHGIYSANCLNRSLVLWWLLQRRGLCSEIRYGARTGAQGFEAHAWVEYANQIIGDNLDIHRDFAPFILGDTSSTSSAIARTSRDGGS
jgi:hypothetical protein